MFGPLVLDTTGSYFNNWTSFVSFDKVVKPGEIGFCGGQKGGTRSLGRCFSKSTVFADIRGSFLIDAGVTEMC